MIVIIGGGISGLSAAYQLKKVGKEFLLLEQSDRLGGKIHSTQIEGFTLEHGPNTVLINNVETKELIEELGLWKELVFPEEMAVKKRFVLKKGKIEVIPNSLASAFKSKLFSFSTLISILSEPLKTKRDSEKEESLAAFCRRRFSNQILEDFIVPFVTGIYAGDPEKMSVNHTLNLLKEAEEKHGSVLKGMMKIMKVRKAENEKNGLPKQKIFSFANGLQMMVKALELELNPYLKFNASLENIACTNGRYEIKYLQDNQLHTIEAEKIISSIPSYVLAKKIEAIRPTLSTKLSAINYAPAVSLHLSIPSDQLTFTHNAFGILSREKEDVPFLGVLFNSRFFPHTAPKGQELITVICGGLRRPEVIEMEEAVLINEVSSSLKKLLGANDDFQLLHFSKWPKGIPQYELGYDKIKTEIEHFLIEHPNFKIAANYYQGISVSDCIKNGINAAKQLIE